MRQVFGCFPTQEFWQTKLDFNTPWENSNSINLSAEQDKQELLQEDQNYYRVSFDYINCKHLLCNHFELITDVASSQAICPMDFPCVVSESVYKAGWLRRSIPQMMISVHQPHLAVLRNDITNLSVNCTLMITVTSRQIIGCFSWE